MAERASDVRRPTSDRLRIGIAGAGLIGRLLAWQLLRRGHAVTLFDSDGRDGEQSAAFVAAAMLAPQSEAVSHGLEIYESGRHAVQHWRELLRQLAEHASTPVMLNDGGSLVVAHELDRANLRHFDQQLHSKLPQRDGVKTLDRGAIAELEPELAERFAQGLWLREEGCLDNRALLRALAEAIDRLGGRWRERCEVSRVDSGQVRSEQGVEAFDLAVDTRGFGGRAQLPGLRGVRGEILWLRAPEVKLQRPVRLMHPRYNLYVSPKPASVYVIGATEIESEAQGAVTVRSSLELLSALYSLHRGFAEAELLHSYARCRPALPDNLPHIEAREGLLRVNGLYRHGYLLAPTVIERALNTVAVDYRQVS